MEQQTKKTLKSLIYSILSINKEIVSFKTQEFS